MFQIIVKCWRVISSIGIDPNTGFSKYKPIILTNRIAFTIILLGFITLINYRINDLQSATNLQTISILFFGLPLVFNYFKRFRLAKITLLASANISLFLSSSLLGYGSGEHYAYFALMIGPFILFKREEKLWMWFFSVFSGFCLVMLEMTGYSLLLLRDLPEDMQKSVYLTNLGVTTVMVIFAINYFRNISEKHIDTIIHDAYEDLKAVFNNSYDAIFILNPHTKNIVDCNERALTIFGFKNHTEALGNSLFSLQKNPDDLRLPIDMHDSLVADRQYLTCEGKEFWGNLAITNVIIDDKALWIARVTDVTESKESSILLENLTRDLEKVQEIAKLSYFHLDAKTREVVYCSKRIIQYLSLPDKPAKPSLEQLVADTHPDYLEQFMTCIDLALTQRIPFNIEIPVLYHQQIRWFSTKSELVTNEQDEVVTLICTSLDITERKQAEEKLQESERNYRKLASNIPDTDIFLFDDQGRIILAEGTIMQRHGLSHGFFEGKHIYDIVDDAYKPLIVPLYEAVLQGEQVAQDIAMGEEFLNMRGVPLRDTQGNISGGLMVSQDITLRKQNEQELVQAKEKAEDASIAKAQFLSIMSHELRTPLNAVIGISHLLLEEAPQPEQLENLHLLRFSAENLLVLINDILDFSKIEAGKVVLETVGFNIRQLLDSTTQMQKIQADEKNLSLTLNIAPDVPDWVSGDPTRLSQILNNLLSNAIKFTSEGSVSLQVVLWQKNQQRATLSFSVKDSGIGIPPDKIDAIFDQFSQADSHTTRQFGGTGLGLAITKKLLLLHNSDIQVSSQVGQGTIFSFDLTFGVEDKPKKEEKKSSSDTAKVALNGVKVLLVEDNATNILIAGKFLKRWQVDFDQAGNGEQAIKKASAHAYDLILMDLQMPVMDGYQAAIEIRKFNKQIPIIALTASAMLEVKEKIRDAKMNDIVVKPFDPEDLYQKIHTWAAPRATAIQ